jgi:hypothetical protein
VRIIEEINAIGNVNNSREGNISVLWKFFEPTIDNGKEATGNRALDGSMYPL